MPIRQPETGQVFPSFSDCVDAIEGEDTSREEARRICGSFEEINKNELTANQLTTNQADPTRTTVLRRRFRQQFNARWSEIRGLIRTSLQQNDALRLNQDPMDQVGTGLTPSEKAEQFSNWMQRVVNEKIRGGEQTGEGFVYNEPEPWTDKPVRTAYTRGVLHADQELRKTGFNVAAEDTQRLTTALSTLTLSQIESSTQSNIVATRASQEAGETLAEGLGTSMARTRTQVGATANRVVSETSNSVLSNIARNQAVGQIISAANGVVSNQRINTSAVIARTEIVRAHANAKLTRFEQMGVDEVTAQAEFMTVGDRRVCGRCAGMEGQVFTIAEARNVIPLHANCRCTWILPGSRGDVNIREARRVQRSTPQDRAQKKISDTLGGSFEDRKAVHLWGGGEPDSGNRGWVNGPKANKQTVRMKRAIKREFDDVNGTIRETRDFNFDSRVMEQTQKDMRQMYEETQEWFQENGIKSVQLYRGAGKARGTFDTASSWSESKQVASEFAEQSVNNIKRKGGTPQPSVFFKEVPVEDILIGHRAPGWENGKYGQQFEWIVMNRGGSGG